MFDFFNKTALATFLLLLAGCGQYVFASEFVSLSGLPGIEPTDGGGLAQIFNILYVIIVVVGSIFAVIKIALAGVKYMLSDVVTDKSSARKDILGALLGLMIILATYVVLTTIYPGLVDFNILVSISPEHLRVFDGPLLATISSKFI